MKSTSRRWLCAVLAWLPACLPLILFGQYVRLPGNAHAGPDTAVVVSPIQVRLLPTPDERPAAVSRAQDQQLALPAATAVAATVADYLPVASLSEWPRPLGTPDAFWLAGDGPSTIIESVLLINEHGDVDQVAFLNDVLSVPERRQLEAQLRTLRFSPGKLFGRPVRSRLRIELRLG